MHIEVILKNFVDLELRDPVLLCSWQGWPDAAESATKSIEEILKQKDPIETYSINSEEYYIYSDKRPHVSNPKPEKRKIDWPENKFSFIKTDNENDLIIFQGVEPDLYWKKYIKEFMSLIKFYDVKQVIMVGSLLDSVPHTRDPRISITATISDKNKFLKSQKFAVPTYEGPAGITSAIGEMLDSMKISSISIWGHTPHYLQVTHNPILSFAIMKKLNDILNLNVNFDKISKRSEEFKSSLNLALEDHKEITKYVERLEESYDTEEMSKIDPEPKLIIKDLENFLKESRENQN